MRLFTDEEIKVLKEGIHETAKEKGWWELDPTTGKALCSNDTLADRCFLIVSELAEAFEEYRKPTNDMTGIYTVDGKPEGFAVELADAYIRVLDLESAVFEPGDVDHQMTIPTFLDKPTISAYFLACSQFSYRVLADRALSIDSRDIFSKMYVVLEKVAVDFGVPLKEALLTKLDYNKTRPFRHGGKRC